MAPLRMWAWAEGSHCQTAHTQMGLYLIDLMDVFA